MANCYQVQDNDILLRVIIKPNAAKTEVIGLHGDRLKIAVNAVPEKGSANNELIKYLAKLFALRQKDIELVRGQSSREKVLRMPCQDEIIGFLNRCGIAKNM